MYNCTVDPAWLYLDCSGMMGVLAETSALSCTACKLFVPAQLGKFPVSLATVQLWLYLYWV